MQITRSITLDGESIRSLEDVYTFLATALPLPGHFGRNLDALWDALSLDVEGPFEIAWKQSELSKKRMGKEFDTLVDLLRDLEKERNDFRLILEP